MADGGPERLKAIADELRQGPVQRGETVRTLLSWFDAQRRGQWVVAEVRRCLDDAELTTEPDFESAYIDSVVYFRAKNATDHTATPLNGTERARTSIGDAGNLGIDGASSIMSDTQPLPPPRQSDPSFRLSKLAAANKVPLSVKPDARLAHAVTLMLAKDYSQLPVMTTEREVKGAISWRSIAARLALNKNGEAVRDFMDPVQILPSEASLFDAIREIAEKQYVLVRAPDQRIVGMVTSSDLSVQFQSLTEPFLLLSEIENDLRRVLQDKFSISELSSVKNPDDGARQISSVHDMNFGEYIILLENPDNWQKLLIPLDRSAFVQQLGHIREIRNDVMHFDPDGIPDADLGALRDFSKFMQRLRDMKVT